MSIVQKLIIIISVFVVGIPHVILASEKECVSLMDIMPEVRKHFSVKERGATIILDETFKDNRNKWFVGKKKQGYYKKYKNGKGVGKLRWSNNKFVISGGSYRIDIGKSLNTIPGINIPSSTIGHDYLIEVCFSINNRGRKFLIRYCGSSIGISPGRNFDPQPKIGINTISVLKIGSQIQEYLNGEKMIGWGWGGRKDEGTRLNLYLGEQGRTEVYSIRILEVPPPPAGTMTLAEFYKKLIKSSHNNSFVNIDGLSYDIRTNLLWNQEGMIAFHKRIGSKRQYNWDDGKQWIKRINKMRFRGFSNWRLPAQKEYRTIFRKNSGTEITKWDSTLKKAVPFKLGYLPPINGLGIKAWINDVEPYKEYMQGISFKDGGLALIRDDAGYEALAVMSINFSLPDLVKDDNNSPVSLTENEVKMFDRAQKAFQGDLPKVGEKLLQRLIATNAQGLYDNGYIFNIFLHDKIPLRYVGKILSAVYELEKASLVYWYWYGHFSGIARQPDLMFQAALKMQGFAKNSLYNKMITDLAAIFKAMAFMMKDKSDEAFTELLMQDDWQKSIVGIQYINKYGGILLKDKTQLASIIGLDETWLSGRFQTPEFQEFYNVETGELINKITSSDSNDNGVLLE